HNERRRFRLPEQRPTLDVSREVANRVPLGKIRSILCSIPVSFRGAVSSIGQSRKTKWTYSYFEPGATSAVMGATKTYSHVTIRTHPRRPVGRICSHDEERRIEPD